MNLLTGCFANCRPHTTLWQFKTRGTVRLKGVVSLGTRRSWRQTSAESRGPACPALSPPAAYGSAHVSPVTGYSTVQSTTLTHRAHHGTASWYTQDTIQYSTTLARCHRLQYSTVHLPVTGCSTVQYIHLLQRIVQHTATCHTRCCCHTVPHATS